MSKNDITIKFFGAFRQYGESIDVASSCAMTVREVKAAVQDLLDNPLVSDSVLANDNRILRDDDMVYGGAVISILPPVCGG